MTENKIFNYLFSGGRYSLPYLLDFSIGTNKLYFVNALEDIEYNGNVYSASTFSYTEPNIYGAGGSLKISLTNNNLLELLDANNQMQLKVVGIINDEQEIEPIHIYNHMTASASWDSNMELSLQLNADDRLSMTFPPYIFDTDNNRGGN